LKGRNLKLDNQYSYENTPYTGAKILPAKINIRLEIAYKRQMYFWL